MKSTLIIEIVLILLLIGCIYLDYKYPCDKQVKFIVSAVVLVKVVLIAYEFKKKGEKKGEQMCEKKYGSATWLPSWPQIA